jgi:hypothetical protein
MSRQHAGRFVTIKKAEAWKAYWETEGFEVEIQPVSEYDVFIIRKD